MITTVEKVFQSMRAGRKYSPGFIASRQNLSLSSVHAALRTLEYGFMIKSQFAQGKNKRRKLYITNQQELKLL